MDNPKISLIRCTDYDRGRVQYSVRRAVDALGGMPSFVRPGARVLIKPNMLAAKEPDKAVTTHPEVVRAVVRLVKEAGGVPSVGDSNAIGAFARVAEVTGIAAVAAEEGARLVELSDAVKVPGHGVFKHFEVAREAMSADLVINLPKAKTHVQMLLTLAVKNLFGCIPGRRKAQWHLRAGVDRQAFATMLVELGGIIKPGLHIVDAVVGMEGNGPGNGRPVDINLIAAGTDATALDMALCGVLGVDPEKMPTIKAARSMGLATYGLHDIKIEGDFGSVHQAKVKAFKLPSPSSVEWSIPEPVRKLLKEALTTKPKLDARACKLCLMCKTACPAGAIGEKGNSLKIDYRACIRCFCCQEVCPVGAIEAVEGWLLRYLG